MRLSGACTWALLLSTAMLASTQRPEVYSDCGGVFTNLTGRFYNYIGPETLCVWTIQVHPGHKILLALPYVSLTCSEEYLEIENGPPGSGSYGKFCEGFGVVYRSSSNAMPIKYSRNAGPPASFFRVLNYYGNPGGTLVVVVMTLVTVVWCIQSGHGVWSDRRCLRRDSSSVVLDASYPVAMVVVVPEIWAQALSESQPHLCERAGGNPGWTSGSNSLGKVCPGFSLVYRPSSNIMIIQYPTNSSKPPNFFGAYYYGDLEELARDVQVRVRMATCPVYQGRRGVLTPWRSVLLACQNEQVEVLDGPSSLGIICRVMSLFYPPSSNYLTMSYSRNAGRQSALFDAYYYRDSQGNFSAAIRIPGRRKGTIHDQTAFSTFAEGHVQQVV
ncbi:Deleted In Malignant Brain Tumors 1 Protein [Manis pentadactyla]|nr:Deleted In Malignant Brain Tumors 1 Protein [Manis pentadactyla]